MDDPLIITSSQKVDLLPLDETIKEEVPEFCWGKKLQVGGINKNVQFYESFTCDGVPYLLYDSVYFWCGEETEPSIAKLVKMWETPSHKKRVKFVWYFRPCEVHHFLGDVKPLEKEIFLASGEGKGLFGIDSPEAIAGKCKVVCVVEDKRNLPVSNEELQMADYIFLRTFNVGNCRLSKRFPDEIAGHGVVHFFNSQRDGNISKVDFKERGKKNLLLKGVTAVGNSVKDEPKVEEVSSGKRPRNNTSPFKEEEGIAANREPRKKKVQFNPVVEQLESSKDWISNDARGMFSDTYPAREEQIRGYKICTKPFEVTRRPKEVSSTWFKPQPWDVKMLRAYEDGTLVLLQNLDPSFTSSEIEDLVWTALNQKVDAKMIPRSTFSSIHCGKALVTFKSKDAAETAISKLTENCLMLPDGRPIVACRGYPNSFYEETKFHGHLTIDLKHHKQHDEWRIARSTSHYSQPNNIEYDLALGWRLLQERSSLWWNALNQRHGKEIDELKSTFKSQYDQQLENESKSHDEDQGPHPGT